MTLKKVWFLFFLCLSGCKKEDPLQKAELSIGIAADNPPFSFRDTAHGGDLKGFEIDLANALTEKLGKKTSFSDMDFGALIGGLQTGRTDFVLAMMSVTPEREKMVDFSVPYFSLHRMALTLAGRSVSLSEGRVGVQLGSTHEAYAKELAAKSKALQVISYNKLGDLLQELKNKRLDVVFVEAEMAHEVAAHHPELVVHKVDAPAETFSIAFPKGSPLKEKINAVLEDMKKDGTLKSLLKKWFKHAL